MAGVTQEVVQCSVAASLHSCLGINKSSSSASLSSLKREQLNSLATLASIKMSPFNQRSFCLNYIIQPIKSLTSSCGIFLLRLKAVYMYFNGRVLWSLKTAFRVLQVFWSTFLSSCFEMLNSRSIEFLWFADSLEYLIWSNSTLAARCCKCVRVCEVQKVLNFLVLLIMLSQFARCYPCGRWWYR